MIKHQITTILENGKYVGIVIKNNEIVFKTEPKNNPNEASAAMTKFIQTNGGLNEGGPKVKPRTGSTNLPLTNAEPLKAAVPSVNQTTAPAATPAPRKCCGRR